MSVIVSAGAGRVVTLSDLVGEPIHDYAAGTTIAGTEVTVLTVTVAAGKKRRLTQCLMSSSVVGKMVVKLNGNVIGVVRTSPAELNPAFNWLPAKPITASDTVAVTFTARASSPSADIEVFLHSAQTDL